MKPENKQEPSGQGGPMRQSSVHFIPLALPFFVALAVLVIVLVALIEIGVLGYAYEKMGVDRRYVFALLMLSLAGSYVNIPVATLPEKLEGQGDWSNGVWVRIQAAIKK